MRSCDFLTQAHPCAAGVAGLQDCALLLQGLPAGTLGRPQEGVQEDRGTPGRSLAAH
jgi:hypothetical protein